MDNLNPLSEFDVSQQSVRDRFNILSKKHKIRMANDKCSTAGGEDELSEIKNVLEELIEIEEETDQRVEEDTTTGQKTIEDDNAKATEIMKRAVVTMGETRKQNQGECNQEKRREGQPVRQLIGLTERSQENKCMMRSGNNGKKNKGNKCS